ncbi:MAG: WYL domain-containing protein [Parashewanella sp.]
MPEGLLEGSKVIWNGDSKTVEFSYENYEGNRTRRKVDVHQVQYNEVKDIYHLYGHCHLRNEMRHFRTLNITSMIKYKSKRFDFYDALEDIFGLTEHHNDVVEVSTNKPEKLSFEQRMEKKLDEVKAQKKAPSVQFAEKSKNIRNVVLGLCALFLAVGLLVDDKKDIQNTTKSVNKFEQLKEYSDCKLALMISNDYITIMNQWATVLDTSNSITYQQALNWKQSKQFDQRLDEIASKYPSTYPANLNNSRIASGFGFRIGQWWRDVFNSLKQSNNQSRGISKQLTLIHQEYNEIKKQCPNEFNQ